MDGTIEPFNPNARSNHPHEHPFVIQAWDASLGQWLDTVHGNCSLQGCETYALPTALQPDRWMGGKVGRVRIVQRLKAA